VAGAAGGMAAIFATPVAAVLLAVELLLFEWKPRSFIPVTLAAVVAGVARIAFFGQGPIFPVPPHPLVNGDIMGFALLVGLIAGLASGLVTQAVYFFENFFEKMPLHWMWWPAIGGLFVGIGGFIDPRVLGVGYDLIQNLLSGHLVGLLALGLLIGKFLVWSAALGSGTSGGVLAPLLIIGGALGAILSHWIPEGDAGLWAMIGMAALMGGTMRAPLTAMIFTIELTHDINVLPALLVGCVGSYALTVFLMPRSILTEKVSRRGYHINCEYSVDLLSITRVHEVMEKNLQTIRDTLSLQDFSQMLASNASNFRRQATLILNDDDELVGLITRGDVFRALESNVDPNTSVLSCGSSKVIVTYPDEILKDAVRKMVQHNVGRLPVVQRQNPAKVIGYLGRSAIIQAQMKQMREENYRESRWFKHG
jgi:CIC family chloride channel protein